RSVSRRRVAPSARATSRDMSTMAYPPRDEHLQPASPSRPAPARQLFLPLSASDLTSSRQNKSTACRLRRLGDEICPKYDGADRRRRVASRNLRRVKKS